MKFKHAVAAAAISALLASSGLAWAAYTGQLNIIQWAGTVLGAPSNYGTSPGAVEVPGVNAFVTNTVPASQSGTWTVQPGNTANTTAWKVDGSAVTQPVSGTVTANAGTNLNTSALATSALQPTNAAQGSTTSGQTGPLVQGAVTTGSPSYTTAQTYPLSLDTAGNLRVNVVTGGGSGGTSAADASSWTAGTTSQTPIGCEYTSGGATALVTAHMGTAGCTTARALFSDKSSVAGTALVAATSAYGTAPTGTTVEGVNAFVTNTNANGVAAAASASPTVSAVSAATALQTAAVANGNGTALTTSGYSGGMIYVNCTVACSGGTTVNFEGTIDGTNFVAMQGMPLSGGAPVTTATTTGAFAFDWAGFSQVRARISGYSAGTITATAVAGATQSLQPFTQSVSAASLPLPTGAATSALQTTINTTLGSPMQNSGGSVTANAGTNLNTSLLATDAHLTSFTSANHTDITALGTSALATDAHLTRQQGVIGAATAPTYMSLGGGVYNSTPPTLTNGQSAALQVNSSGALLVSGGAGGTSSSFSSAFPSTGTAAGAEYLSSPPSLTSGQMVPLQVTSAGSLHATVDNANTNGQTTMSGSSPVTIASDQSAVPASQSGTWNVTNVSGTVSLPTGAATSANQSTANTSLSSIATNTGASATDAHLTRQQGVIGNATAPTYMSLGGSVYNSTPLTLTNGQSSALQSDASGYLNVHIQAGAGSGGTAIQDNTAFTQGTTSENPIGCLYNTGYAAATSGRSTVARCDSSGQLIVGGTGTFATQSAVTAASGAFASGSIASGALASGALAPGSISSGAAVSGAFADGSLVTLGAKADAKSTATDTTAITVMQVLKEISAMAQAPAALPANQSVNNAQVNGVTMLTGAGATGTGAQRVTAAQDTTTIAGSAPGTAGSASANVVTVQGVASMTPVQVSQATAGNLNATVVGTGTFAVQSTLQAGSAIVGKVGIDQTTPGTTNGVQVNAALPAGANTIGKVDILGNAGAAVDAATGAAPPANAILQGVIGGGATGGHVNGMIQADSSAAINVSTATTTQLVALAASQKIYVTSYDVIAGGTGNITFEYGTGSTCGTGTTILTGAYNLTAQAGIAKGNGVGPVLVVPAGNALCVLTSAAVQMSGSVAYAQF